MAESEPGTRDQIVTATRKLIEDRGTAHGTTKKIAQAAGCAEGTIFRYFARKEDLLLTAVIANFPTFKESLMSISEGTPSQRLHRLGLNVIRFLSRARRRRWLFFPMPNSHDAIAKSSASGTAGRSVSTRRLLVSSNRRKHAGMRRESGNGQRRGVNLRHLLYPGALRTDISPVP